MREQIQSFLNEHNFPEEAIASLLADFDVLEKSEQYPLFKAYVDMYNTDHSSFDYSLAIGAVKKIAAAIGVSNYTLELLLFIAFAKHCKELYEEAGLSLQIYYDTMEDLKWKTLECKKMHNVWGTFVAWWENRFFDLSRFAIGRLQYEDDPAQETYEKNGVKINYGDWVVSIHVPSSGKLNIEDCKESLRQAAEFFADDFPDGIAKFRCHSWLLAPNHKDYLAPETGIRKFADLFDVVRGVPSESRGDFWRIFYRKYEGGVEGFPAETSLQRAYLKMYEDGVLPETGVGYILMKDGEIL